MKRVLITGAAGYIGSVLTRQLLNRGDFVRGLDLLNFGGESLLGVYTHPNFEFMKGDVRDSGTVARALDGIDAVVHLAAIVGDPACAKDPETAESTNWGGSVGLYQAAMDTPRVKQFVFASTCSNYGKMEGDGYVQEDSPLRPVSLYAQLKVRFEEFLMNSDPRPDFTPTSLRFATVYGASPRIRFDLTVNEFTREVVMGRELVVFGEQFWRPYTHVDDLARSCVVVLDSPSEKVRCDVFGVGDTEQNYQKKMIVDEIVRQVPDAKVQYVRKDEDPRDYRVDFSKIRDMLGYRITKTVPDGIAEIKAILEDGILIDPFAAHFKNI